MPFDGLYDLGGPTTLGEDGHPRQRVLVQRGMLFVVQIVKQPRGRPQLLILAVLPGVGTHGRFHRQSVLEQARRFGVLGQQIPGILTSCFQEIGLRF